MSRHFGDHVSASHIFEYYSGYIAWVAAYHKSAPRNLRSRSWTAHRTTYCSWVAGATGSIVMHGCIAQELGWRLGISQRYGQLVLGGGGGSEDMS